MWVSGRVKTRESNENRTDNDSNRYGKGKSKEVTEVVQLDAKVTEVTEPVAWLTK